MRGGDQQVAVVASRHQAVLNGGGRAQLLHQEQPDNQQQQGDHDANKTGGLARRDLVAGGFVEQRTMCIQTTLPLRRRIPTP